MILIQVPRTYSRYNKYLSIHYTFFNRCRVLAQRKNKYLNEERYSIAHAMINTLNSLNGLSKSYSCNWSHTFLFIARNSVFKRFNDIIYDSEATINAWHYDTFADVRPICLVGPIQIPFDDHYTCVEKVYFWKEGQQRIKIGKGCSENVNESDTNMLMKQYLLRSSSMGIEFPCFF